MKKVFKWLAILILILALLCAAGVGVLYVMFPPAKLKAMAQDYVKQNFHREVKFDSLSLNIIGLTLKGFALSEAQTFADGTFVAADKTIIKIALKPLFKKRVEIKTIGLEGITINIAKDKQGKFNFDDLLALAPAAAKQEPVTPAQAAAAPMAIALVAERVYIKNATLSYKDAQTDMAFSVNDFNFAIHNFDLANPFAFDGSLSTSLQMAGISVTPVNLELKGTAHVANLELAKAYLDVADFSASYKHFKAALSGRVQNFDAPEIGFKIAVTGVDDKLAKNFAPDVPAFNFAPINIDGNLAANLQTMDVKGHVAFADIGATAVGRELKGLTGQININSINDVKTNIIKGAFDGEPFTTSFAYAKPAANMQFDFKFDMANFTLGDVVLPTISSFLNAGKTNAPAAATSAQQAYQPLICQSCPRSAPMDVKAALNIGRVSNNVFETSKITLSADVKNIDSRMDKATGRVSFSTQNGEIKDLDKLMQSSPIIRMALMVVSLVKDAQQKLKLEGAAAGERVAYQEIAGDYSLANGVVKINKTDLSSDIMTLKTTGDIGLLTEKLNIKAQTHFGKMGASGFKPVVIKIGGTMQKPSYGLDVAGSISNIIKSPADAKKAVQDTKDAIKNIGNLFKK